MTEDIYSKNWQKARAEALKMGLKIVEHGWEQHVIVDAEHDVLYRYPRSIRAAAMLGDEVRVLSEIHKEKWRIKLPVMFEHNEIYTAYHYIEGEVLNEKQLRNLKEKDFKKIGQELGRFLAQLHDLDHSIIQEKHTKHDTTLLEYYTERIKSAPDIPQFPLACQALAELVSKPLDMNAVTVHGDLHGLNIVIDPKKKKLNGVIDLSEMEIGDHHQDFRKIFMTDPRLIGPAIEGYEKESGRGVDERTVELWAHVNEWANFCHFHDRPLHPTYLRALNNLRMWHQFDKMV